MMTDSFLDYLRFEKNYSEKTIVSYGIDLTKFEEYFKGKDEKVDFTTVDADLVRGWVMNLMENGYTSASVNRKLSSLRSFYRFLLKKGADFWMMFLLRRILQVVGIEWYWKCFMLQACGFPS